METVALVQDISSETIFLTNVLNSIKLRHNQVVTNSGLFLCYLIGDSRWF